MRAEGIRPVAERKVLFGNFFRSPPAPGARPARRRLLRGCRRPRALEAGGPPGPVPRLVRRSATSGTSRSTAACSSIQNANASLAATPLVRITHPFHPLSGRQFVCVGKRHNRYGARLLLQIDDAAVFSVPPQWTDIVAPDLEVVIGKRRSLFRVADLMELAGFVERLGKRDSLEKSR